MASTSTSRDSGGRRFYTLSPSYATRYHWAYADDQTGDEIGRMGLRELADFRGTARFEAREGTIAADFMWNDLLLPIVSTRVVELLRRHEVNGYKLFNVIVSKKDEAINGYHGMAVTGRGGPNDSKAYEGGFMPGTKIRRVKGLCPTEWDGSDLFTLDDFPRAPLATDKVKDIFTKNKVTNCKLEPAEEFQIGY